MLYKACSLVDAGNTGGVIAADVCDIGKKMGLDVSEFDSIERFSHLRFFQVSNA